MCKSDYNKVFITKMIARTSENGMSLFGNTGVVSYVVFPNPGDDKEKYPFKLYIQQNQKKGKEEEQKKETEDPIIDEITKRISMQ